MVNPQTAHLKDSLAILSNKRVIAVNQDPLGAGGYRVLRDNPATNAGFDVVVKPLKDGSLAALVLNKNASEQTYTLKLATLGLAPAANGAYTVHHLWTGASQSSVKAVTMRIAPPHDNMMLRIVGGGALTPPTGQIQTVQPSFDVAAKCLSVEGSAKPGAGIIIDNCSNSAKQQWQRQANGRIRLLDSNLCLSANNGPVNSSHSQWAKLDACLQSKRPEASLHLHHDRQSEKQPRLFGCFPRHGHHSRLPRQYVSLRGGDGPASQSDLVRASRRQAVSTRSTSRKQERKNKTAEKPGWPALAGHARSISAPACADGTLCCAPRPAPPPRG
ncbi:ricin-type beta-trefoil lectin domain protein [Chromobacterium haemolyticum]|nr:ricin-type beta-trefoil lectin domain protein [Chromobacterium haemolyticum]